MEEVRLRFAPSPTGSLHIGGIRTFLFNWAFARKNKGKMILRIEDTDRDRFVVGATEEIIQMIKDYGLDYDEGPDIGGPYGPYIQSQRLEIYQKYAQKLISRGIAYYCFCSQSRLEEVRKKMKEKGLIPKYDRHCLNLSKEEVIKKINSGEKYVIRLRVPDNEILRFNDLVMGEISFNTNDIDDQVLIKSDGYPTYHLAVCVDDGLMKISHILRGAEWISSTPKHILIFKALDFEVPKIGHLPVILDPEGGKLSKRKGAVAAKEFLAKGYLPEAVLNFLMLLGWAPDTDKEIFSLEEFVKEFSLEKINKSSPVFNSEKLDWFNGIYIRKTQISKLKDRIYHLYQKKYPKDFIEKTIPLIKDRMVKLTDFEFLVSPIIAPNFSNLSNLANAGDFKKEHIQKALEALSKIEHWNLRNINESLTALIEKSGFKTGDFYMSLRIAICGCKITPPINETLEILGKKETIFRLKTSLNLFHSNL